MVTAVDSRAAFEIFILGLDDLEPDARQAFEEAETIWESAITGYIDDVNVGGGLGAVLITASVETIDGDGLILGEASATGGRRLGDFFYTTTGFMRFDAADVPGVIADGRFTSLVVHEMAHVLGFGSLWTANDLYVNNSGEYTGEQALAAYREEFDPAAMFVPVELEGAAGTVNAHWDEVLGGAGPTGRVDPFGRDMQFEVMTGWLNQGPFLSNTTIASFGDLGYTVQLNDIPEPTSLALVLAGGCLVNRRRRQG